MAVRYHDEQVQSKLKQRRKLKAYLATLFEKHGFSKEHLELDYIFCSDNYLLRMNKQYLQHDDLTDVITFDLSPSEEMMQGEIYISVERVAENAIQFGAPYQRELLRVMFHGALHLCGYKDKTVEESAAMRAAEHQCLTEFAEILEYEP